MKDNPLLLLLLVGALAVITAASLVSFKLGLFTGGMVCLLTAWNLLRGGRTP